MQILTNAKLLEIVKMMDEVNPSDLRNKANISAGNSDITEI
jgi:hypothetical protein